MIVGMREHAAWRVADNHGLGNRADEPLGGVVVLLSQAADALSQATMMILRSRPLRLIRSHIVEDTIAMAQDALVLAAISPSTPTRGIIDRIEDGSLR